MSKPHFSVNQSTQSSRKVRKTLTLREKLVEKEGEKEIRGAINVQLWFGQYLVMLYFQKYNAIP